MITPVHDWMLHWHDQVTMNGPGKYRQRYAIFDFTKVTIRRKQSDQGAQQIADKDEQAILSNTPGPADQATDD